MHIGYTTVKIQKTERRKVYLNKNNKRVACVIIAFLALAIVLPELAMANPTPDIMLSGATGAITITPAEILAMPTTSGLGGWRSMGGSVTTGSFVGVSLQYLCDLVGGISSSGNCSAEVAQTLPAADAYSQNLTYQQIYNAAQSLTFYNASTGNTQTPTQPITLIIAYECNGTDLPSSWGAYRLMPVGPEGLVGTGKLSVSSVDTVAVSGYPTGYNSLTYSTCNSNGVSQSTFNSGDDVCFTATGLNSSTAYDMEVVPYNSAWSTGMSIPTPVSTTSITTDGSGNIALTSIYSPAASGQYDVIVKPVAETDGTYDAQDLLITNVVTRPGPGLFVLLSGKTQPTPDLTLSGATGTITITPAEILAMPTTSGLGGWRSMGGSVTTGSFVGVSLQYLCNLVGGISSSGNCYVEVAQTLPAADAYSQNLTYVNITDAAQTLIFYNATTGNLQTPTQPITLIIAYECNGTDLPSSWGAYRLMPVGPEGLVGTGKLSVSSVDTVAVSGYPTGYNSLTYSTCNSNGVSQSTFNSGDDVCFTATGLSPSTAYNVEVIPYNSAWSTGMSIPTPVSTTSITTDGSGNIALTSIYSPAASGQYDVIVKPANETDGTYDAQDVLITNVVTSPGPGIFVLYEYDVAVTNVISYKTIIGQGYVGNVTVTTENLGTNAVTFNLTVYANATYIASQNVTLLSGNSANVNFLWNTTGFAYGNYTLSAYAWPVPGETNISNNNYTGGSVYVGIPGDVEGIGKVNMGNVVDILRAFGSTVGRPNYNPNCDIENNGKVDMGDVVIALRNFGQQIP
jgi:hypothetical protein